MRNNRASKKAGDATTAGASKRRPRTRDAVVAQPAPTRQPSAELLEELVYLKGRPPIGEYLRLIRGNAVDVDATDLGAIAEEWRVANDHIRDLEVQESGWADGPTISELPELLRPLQEMALDDPMFRRAYSVIPAGMGIVELDRLVVYQKGINLGYVQQLRQAFRRTPSEEEVFRICVPLEEERPGVQLRKIGEHTFAFGSPSQDLRFLDCAILQSQQITGYQPSGPVAGVVGLMIGYGTNCLTALHIENRLVLANGSHRAFALREMGFTHVPCVIQRVSRLEELPMVADPELASNTELFLRSPRPPVLKDYFDPKLRKLMVVPKRTRHVVISYNFDIMNL
jgi:hypothetical protein